MSAMSNDSSDSEISSAPVTEDGVTGTLVVAVVLSAVAIVSNGLLIYVVVRTAALRTSANFFIASLSAGELLTGLFVIPFAGTSARSGGDREAFSPALCRFVGVMGVMGPCVSTLSLLAVSADRCVAVSRPFRYATLVTGTTTAVVIAGVWAWSLMVSLLPLAEWGQYSYSGSFRMCLMRSSGARTVPEVVVKETLSIFLPVALVVFAVLKTVHHIRGHRRVFVLVPALVAATSVPVLPNNVGNARSSNVKASRTLLLVFSVFVTLCVPSAVASILCQHPTSCPVDSTLLQALLWLSFLSCVINPVIIMTLNRKFRARLKGLFRCSLVLAKLPCVGGADKEPFTISSGLQTILDTSLLVKVVKEGQPDREAAQLGARRLPMVTLHASTLDHVHRSSSVYRLDVSHV